jgi:CHAT domain-containing protein
VPRLALALVLPIILAACSTPPEEVFISTSSVRSIAGQPIGNDTRGEPCLVQAGRPPPTDRPAAEAREAFCGGWTQPAARVVRLNGSGDLDTLAAGGVWRTWLGQRLACGPAQSVRIAGGLDARMLSCTRRSGGWPHVAIVIAAPNGTVLADGLPTALPVIERLARGEAGTTIAAGRSEALELAARRLSADAFGAGDVGRYEELMAFGRDLNQAESFGAAEDAYRAALAVQESALGRDNPGTADALVHLALNLSNQRRIQEAGQLFARAEALAPRAADPTLPVRLTHYRALHHLALGETDRALALLAQAEAGYGALLPPELLDTTPLAVAATASLVADPLRQTAVFGVAEVRRSRGVALNRLGRPEEAAQAISASRTVMRRAGLEPSMIVGRVLRSQAGVVGDLGRGPEAARLLEQAAARFRIAAPGERPEAVTLFLAGARRLEAGDRLQALSAFRAGADILRARQISLSVALVIPYLDALDAELRANPATAAATQAEMFGAAQLAQRSSTARFVQQATARLAAAGGDQRVGDSVRRLQDADQALRTLFNQRDARASPDPALDARIAELQEQRAEAEAEVAAAAPGYRQLLQTSAGADAVKAALRPGEAMVSMLLGPRHGFVFAVTPRGVTARRTALSEPEAERLVGVLRDSVAPNGGASGPGTFDPAPAQRLHELLLGGLADAIGQAPTLVVAPDGPLLALPFGMLLSGPADPQALAAAPWLIRRHAIIHVPSPQTFVTRRASPAGSTAPLPYIGFGDFRPPSAGQLARAFPADRCATDARVARGLGLLPGTRLEVQLAAELLRAAPGQVRLGPAFTTDAVKRAALHEARIVHFATHALLPGELSCLLEPTILASTPPGAASADSAFLSASDVLRLRLDADLVILSACNTAGPGGGGGGEALSGLARSFFYAGARGLLATHWAVEDAAATLTVADTLRRQEDGAASADALRNAQLLFLDAAGRRLPAAYAHPYYWAPFALIGEGRQTAPTARVAAAGR